MVSFNAAALLLLAAGASGARTTTINRNPSMQDEELAPLRTNTAEEQIEQAIVRGTETSTNQRESVSNIRDNMSTGREQILTPETPDTPENEGEDTPLSVEITIDDEMKTLDTLILAPEFDSQLYGMDSEIYQWTQILVESWSEHPDLTNEDMPEPSIFKPTPSSAIEFYEYGEDASTTLAATVSFNGRVSIRSIPAGAKVSQQRGERQITGTVVETAQYLRTGTNLKIKYDVPAFSEEGCNPENTVTRVENCFGSEEMNIEFSNAFYSANPIIERNDFGEIQYESIQQKILKISDKWNEMKETLPQEQLEQIPFAQESQSFETMCDSSRCMDDIILKIMTQPEPNQLPQPTTRDLIQQTTFEVIQTIPYETMPWDAKILAMQEMIPAITIRQGILQDMEEALQLCDQLVNGDESIDVIETSFLMTKLAEEAKYSYLGSQYYTDTEQQGSSMYKMADTECKYWDTCQEVKNEEEIEMTLARANIESMSFMNRFVEELVRQQCTQAKEWADNFSDVTTIANIQEFLRSIHQMTHSHTMTDLEKAQILAASIPMAILLDSRDQPIDSFKEVFTLFDIISVDQSVGEASEFKINYKSIQDINIDFDVISQEIVQALPAFNLECSQITGSEDCSFDSKLHDLPIISSSYIFQSDVSSLLEFDYDILKHKQLTYKVVEKLQNGESIEDCEPELEQMYKLVTEGEYSTIGEFEIQFPSEDIPQGTQVYAIKEIDGQQYQISGVTTESCDTQCNVLKISYAERPELESVKCDVTFNQNARTVETQYTPNEFCINNEDLIIIPSIMTEPTEGEEAEPQPLTLKVERTTLTQNKFTISRFSEMSGKVWKMLSNVDNPEYTEQNIHQRYAKYYAHDLENEDELDDFANVIYKSFISIARENRLSTQEDPEITPVMAVIAAHESIVTLNQIPAALAEFEMAILAMQQQSQGDILTNQDAVEFLDKSFAIIVGSLHDVRDLKDEVQIASTFQVIAEQMYANFPPLGEESITNLRSTTRGSTDPTEALTIVENPKIESYFLVELKELYNTAQEIILNEEMEINLKITELENIYEHVEQSCMGAVQQQSFNLAAFDDETSTRLQELQDKQNEGTLSPEEQKELDQLWLEQIEQQAKSLVLAASISPLYFGCDVPTENDTNMSERDLAEEFNQHISYKEYNVYKVEETKTWFEGVKECLDTDVNSLYTVIVNGKPVSLEESIKKDIEEHKQI